MLLYIPLSAGNLDKHFQAQAHIRLSLSAATTMLEKQLPSPRTPKGKLSKPLTYRLTQKEQQLIKCMSHKKNHTIL
jgi:hypothetical protein